MSDSGLRSQQLGVPASGDTHRPQHPEDASRTPWPKVQTHVQDPAARSASPPQSNAPDRTSRQMGAAEGVDRKEG